LTVAGITGRFRRDFSVARARSYWAIRCAVTSVIGVSEPNQSLIFLSRYSS